MWNATHGTCATKIGSGSNSSSSESDATDGTCAPKINKEGSESKIIN